MPYLLLKVTVAEQGACLDVQRAIPDRKQTDIFRYSNDSTHSAEQTASRCTYLRVLLRVVGRDYLFRASRDDRVYLRGSRPTR